MNLEKYVKEFLEYETAIFKKIEETAIIKFKQAQIIKEVYQNYGTEGIFEFSELVGYNPEYLLAHLKILKKFKSEEDLIQALREGKIRRISDVIRGEPKEIFAPLTIARRIEKNLEIIEKKVVETEELLSSKIVPSEEDEFIKKEFEEFKKYIKTQIWDKISEILYEIARKERTREEKIALYDALYILLKQFFSPTSNL